MRVYARIAIGVLNALFVVIVGLVALLVTATVALNTLRDNGDRHVQSVGTAATDQVDAFFADNERVSRGMADFSRMAPAFAFPSEHPTRVWPDAQLAAAGIPAGGSDLVALERLWWTLLAEAEFKPTSLMIWLRDGTRVITLPIAGTRRFQVLEVMFQNRTTPQAQGAPEPLDRTIQLIEPAQRRMVPHGEQPTHDAYIATRQATYPRIDMRFPPVSLAYAALNTTPGAEPIWSNLRYYYDGAHNPYMYAVSAFSNRTGHHLGYVFTTVLVGGIGDQLQHVLPSRTTEMFVLDDKGFLLAATNGMEIFNTTALDRTVPTPAGCTSTDESRTVVPSFQDLLMCRHHARDAASPQLRAVNDAGLVRDGAQSKVTAEGTKYFARTQRLSVRLSGFVVVVLPESEILGDVRATTTIAGIVTAAVVVAAALLSFFAVWGMLHPLHGIAERMGKAARLEDDPGEVDDSVLVEIGDLQRAFKAMRDELTRIRAFVPQSLLRATTSSDSDAERDDDDDVRNSVPRESSFSPSASTRSRDPHMSMSSLSQTKAASVTQRTDHSSEVDQVDAKSDAKDARYAAALRRPQANPPKAGGGARILGGLRTDAVSVLAVNLRGFNAATARGVSAQRVAAMVDAVLFEAQQEKGVVDSFHGDRFIVTFNAARPAANHGIRASVAGVRICAALRAIAKGEAPARRNSGVVESPPPSHPVGYDLPVTCGVASGTAHIGNLGSDSMKRFSIVGNVFSQATVLERMCKLHRGAQCLVPARLFEDLRTAVVLRTVDFVRLPFAKVACLVADVVQEQALAKAADNEWMYQLQGAAAQDSAAVPTATANEARLALVRGDVSRARALTEAIDPQCAADPLPDPALHEAARQRLHAAVATAASSGSAQPTSLGVFYEDACAPAATTSA